MLKINSNRRNAKEHSFGHKDCLLIIPHFILNQNKTALLIDGLNKGKQSSHNMEHTDKWHCV